VLPSGESVYNLQKMIMPLESLGTYQNFDFPVARSQTPTAAFESMGLRYVPPTLPFPPAPTGSLRAGVELPGLLSPLTLVKFVSIVLSFMATSGEWRTLNGPVFFDCPDLPRRFFSTSQPKASRPAMNFIFSADQWRPLHVTTAYRLPPLPNSCTSKVPALAVIKKTHQK